ncbi:hypothetical protein [Tenacibaculum sp.]|uniref:hypothetical protein n=1 Tax=Tenacibaculum sp. TaxID=1906242 RepID=UPI003D0F0CDB
MKNSILSLGKILNKLEQKKIKGNGDETSTNDLPNSRGCYEQPVSNVDCVSPWEYIPGCGYTCMIAPTGP